MLRAAAQLTRRGRLQPVVVPVRADRPFVPKWKCDEGNAVAGRELVSLIARHLRAGTVPWRCRAPTGLVTRPTVARHLEGLMIDAILLGQPHHHTEALGREDPAGSTTAIRRAVELMEEHPDEPWTVVGLAQQVHLSVRALQYGFNRDYDTTPMSYLRTVRLRHARAALLSASADATTVRDVALSCGFLHMSRFAVGYRETYGEAPSTTLTRTPGTPKP